MISGVVSCSAVRVNKKLKPQKALPSTAASTGSQNRRFSFMDTPPLLGFILSECPREVNGYRLSRGFFVALCRFPAII